MEVSKLSASLGSMGATVAAAPGSPTTRSASRHLATATCWSSVPDTRPTTQLVQTTSSPSPPPTTRSPSPATSATTSPLHTPSEDHRPTSRPPPSAMASQLHAVHAAVHRADTGIITTSRHTHTSTVRMPSSHKSEGSLDHPLPATNNFTNICPSQTQSQNDLNPKSSSAQSSNVHYEYVYSATSLPKRQLWQRSASCRDLYDFSFEESGQAKRRAKPPKPIEKAVISFEERKLESPITRYDDHHTLYSSSRDSSLEIHQDIMVPDQKVYSSSYPGMTSYSQESMEDPGNYDLRDSQDDISHDSYELLEKSDDDYSNSAEFKYKKSKPLNTRSCSLDSGNYMPSDSDSEDKRHKCKSTNDVYTDIFAMEDPRDFPREIIPRKSDGSFYRHWKSGSRTSSLESKSDYYDSKTSKSSKESLKKRERSIGSRTSSQESKSDYETKKIRKNKSAENIHKRNDYFESRSSSMESKSEYYDANSKIDEKFFKKDYDRKINFERNYGTQKRRDPIEVSDFKKETSRVHSISLQNVETEQNIRSNRLLEQNTIPRTQKSSYHSNKSETTHIWPETLPGVPTEIEWPKHQSGQRSTESESNIFSFDEDKIQSLQESSDLDICPDHSFSVVPNIDDVKPESKQRKNYRDVFMEIEPRSIHEIPLHQPIERTKSDPNSLARQRLSSARRLLMHQKSIDLTPYESSDEDYLYKQIPSAPPITKYKGTHFELPTAEFGHFDILKREVQGQKTKFEVPKSQFEVLGAKTQSDFINLPPKDDDISYVLHKRHVMNGTAAKDEVKLDKTEPETSPPKKPAPESQEKTKLVDELKAKSKVKAKSADVEPESSFLFTQNIDLSKVDPVTLEVDKSVVPVQHLSSPKRDITHIDPVLLEALNSKLSQIESDSPTSSKTESLKPLHKIFIMQNDRQNRKDLTKTIEPVQQPKSEENKESLDDKLKPKESKIKTDIKPKRIIKPRMQPGKGKGGKVNKTKVRITSFSSDDESLDSDDVFGSTEATPTRIEFSPPQMRKEMESILKFESERKYLQYTMSSTEVEGSPPTTRKKTDKQYDNGLDPNLQTELRRISERSFSIPSSEDDFNIQTTDLQPVFAEVPDLLNTVDELDGDGERSNDETLKEELNVNKELSDLDAEREREKILLNADIEEDIKDLRVPSRTKITEILSPSLRRKGQSPLLFAHARLNLSEGTAFSLLQKQQALESPLPGRRAKSLDAPVIPVSRLPPLNAFSSKDDTVEEEDQLRGTSEEITSDKSMTDEGEKTPVQEKPPVVKPTPIIAPKPEIKVVSKEDSVKEFPKEAPKAKEKPIKVERDQIVPEVIKSKKVPKTTVQTKMYASKQIKSKAAVNKIASKEPMKERSVLKPLPPKATKVQKPTTLNTKPALPPKREHEHPPDQKSLPPKPPTSLIDTNKTKSQDGDPTKRGISKEKARSLEKLELRRMSSKERTRSQEDSDTDIAKRKEKQQMLYETAIKQTKTIKSPVKDVLPVFPQVEESVRERHGRLEISINTIEPSVSLEEAIIITKSPKKLDKKITKSLDLNLTGDDEEGAKTVQRLGKSLDLDSKTKDDFKDNEFDFQPETISSIQARDLKEASPENAGIQETVTVDVHGTPLTTEGDDKIILEGTSLDVWLSVDELNKSTMEEAEKSAKLENIQVIHKSDDFFESRTSPKPPDLCKLEPKSSSDSRSSIEKVSLGNSLDIKYIDDSGDSSHKSEQDAQLIAEMQKASATVAKFIRKKLETHRPKKEQIEEIPENLVRITSEDESLTEVSELKCEDIDRNLLAVDEQRNSVHRLSIERSRSEDTGSWMTVECDEYIGAESSLDYDNALDSPEKQMATIEIKEEPQPEEDIRQEPDDKSGNLLTTDRINKLDLLKRSSDQSRSSDTTGSWTSGEKDGSPGNNIKETDESSASCSMGRAIGLSQTIEMFGTRDQLDKGSPDSEPPRSPRSPRICVLGRAFTIDEESISQKLEGSNSSDEAADIPEAEAGPSQEFQRSADEADSNEKYKKVPYPFEEKWSNDSELAQKLHKKLSKKMSSNEKSVSSIDDSLSDKRKNGVYSLDKPSLQSVEKLSTESRNSLDTESSSGSLGVAHRMQKSGDIPKELSSTWKPFPLDSSGSESFEDNLLPPDQDTEKQEYFLCRDNSGDFTNLSDVYYRPDSDITPTRDDTDLPEDLANFPANLNYPSLTSGIINLGSDILSNYAGPGYLSRTLSRISERSTNSEKSSLEEDSTKASTQSDSLNDESMESSNQQGSVSSGSHNNARLSEQDKKTPTNELPDTKFSDKSKPSDKISYEKMSNISSSLLQRQISDDRRTSAEMAELSIDDIEIISERGLRLKRQNSDDTIIDEECFEPEYKESKRSSSQESDEWPLPDIPNQGQKPLLAMHEVPSSDTSQQTTQVFIAPKANIPKTFGLRGSLKSQESEQWPSPPSSVTDHAPIVENVETYYITPPQEACKVHVDSISTYDNESNSDNENRTLDMDTDKTHTYENVPTEHISESFSESLSVGPSGIKITLRKSESQGSNSDEDLNLSNLNDDVFTDAVDMSRNELRPQTAMRRSSDDSYQLKPESPRGSHSSYSEEDCTSSMGTNLEDGTVRYALKPTKCTHSSHSEDTSIALSLSEWSNSTTTVKFQNLSSNSGTTKSSSGLKSDENSLTDIAQSISEWSSSNSNTLKAQNVTSIQFQKLSSTTSTGDSTLTDLIPTISEWSNSDNAQQQYFSSSLPERQCVSRMGTSIDVEELSVHDQKSLQSPKNIPSEDLSMFSSSLPSRSEQKYFTKSTERPIVIPLNVHSDTDSSIEQRTVHIQRYDKDKQKYMQKHQGQSKSLDRQIKVPLKLAKCSPYYSSSLSSESTPLAGTSPIPINKTATVPLTRSHKKPVSKSICMAKSPPSENDSTSSIESPRSKSERDRRACRRKRQTQNQRKLKLEREQSTVDEYYFVEHEAGLTEYNEYIRHRNMEEMASNFQYEGVLAEDSPVQYSEALEEGYFPDGDSQSGSDIFRMEKEEDERFEVAEGFDVTSIPPPLLEDDFEAEQPSHI